ncbi:hypothetical protein D3C71_692670 [compost metagenome]
MKIKKIKYTIEEPCHADWDQMKPEAQGRFCESCSTNVVDFTVMSDFSIVHYMESKKNESVCGRFTEGQLKKDYQWMKPQHALSFDLRAVVLGLALSTFSALPSQAQNSIKTEQHDSVGKRIPEREFQGRIISGYDHKKDAFTGGKIKLSGKNDYHLVRVSLLDSSLQEITSITPTKLGSFKIPLDWSKNPIGIKVTAPGHLPQTIYFSNQKVISNLAITLYVEEHIWMGKVLPKGSE